MSPLKKFGQLLTSLNLAKQQTGKSRFEQLREIRELANLPGQLSPSEYFEYQLFNDELYSKEQKARFLGYKAFELYSRLNNTKWHATANDKLVYYSIMKAANMPIPEIFGIISSTNRRFADAATINSKASLAEFLTNNQHYPIFIKPIHGVFGYGTALVESYDAESETMKTRLGDKDLSSFWQELERYLHEGVIIQELLTPSENMKKVCGNRLSSVRLLVLQTPDGPIIHRNAWKIPVGNNIVDNTDHWRNGNMVASADPESGIVFALCRGDNGIAKRDVDQHPETGTPILDHPIPDYEAQKQYVLDAAPLFHDIKYQGWDITTTNKGAIALELNLVTQNTVIANQFVGREGMLDAPLKKMLKL